MHFFFSSKKSSVIIIFGIYSELFITRNEKIIAGIPHLANPNYLLWLIKKL